MTRIDLLPAPVRTRAALAACLALLAACSRHEPPATPKPTAQASAATPAPAAAPLPAPQALDDKHDEAIMRALFGDAYDAAKGSARTTITADGAQQDVEMTLDAAATLPDGRVGAVVNGMPVQDDTGFASHGTPGILNVYVLRRAGNGWSVEARHEHVDELGSHGHMGGTRWVMLGAGKPGFIVNSGGVWQGYSVSSVDIYELGKTVRGLGGFQDASSSSGACMPESGECWDVDSDVRLADEVQSSGYRDILADFKGRRYTVTEGKDGKEVEHLKSTIRQTTRYRFDGKTYVLKDGSNPVPSI